MADYRSLWKSRFHQTAFDALWLPPLGVVVKYWSFVLWMESDNSKIFGASHMEHIISPVSITTPSSDRRTDHPAIDDALLWDSQTHHSATKKTLVDTIPPTCSWQKGIFDPTTHQSKSSNEKYHESKIKIPYCTSNEWIVFRERLQSVCSMFETK